MAQRNELAFVSERKYCKMDELCKQAATEQSLSDIFFRRNGLGFACSPLESGNAREA